MRENDGKLAEAPLPVRGALPRAWGRPLGNHIDPVAMGNAASTALTGNTMREDGACRIGNQPECQPAAGCDGIEDGLKAPDLGGLG